MWSDKKILIGCVIIDLILCAILIIILALSSLELVSKISNAILGCLSIIGFTTAFYFFATIRWTEEKPDAKTS